MNKQAPATMRRPLLPARPWLTGRAYDLLTRPNVLHADLHAYMYGTGLVAFSIEYRSRGRVLVAQDWYALTGDALLATDRATLGALSPLTWTRASNASFERAHGALIGKAREAPKLVGAAYVSVLAHYVPRPDADPFPRGFVNHYGMGGMAGTRAGSLALPDLL